MLKASITLLREKFKDSGYHIFCDSAKLYDSKSKYTTLVWDDIKELLYSFRPNNSHYDQDTNRMVVDVTEYSIIQFISANVNRPQLVDILNKMKEENTVTDEVIVDILKSYDSLDNKLL